MPLTKLQFRPGINREVTSYSNEGGWRDCDKIRFRFGYPEKMGGWQKFTEETYDGSVRALHNWIALDGSDFLGLGSHLKYYIEEGQTLNNITPIRSTTSAGDVTFAATNGSATITVTDVGHGAFQFDFVTFSGAASLGGVITATVLNQEYQVSRVVDANTYEITSAVAANSSDSGNGGSSTVGTYQINVGLDTAVGGTGWGAGLYYGVTNGAAQTTLNEGGTLTAGDTTITLATTNPGHQIIAGDVVLIGTELILVGGVSSNDLTSCTRGHSGTTATTHADGSVVRLALGNADPADDFSGWGDAASGGLTTTTQIRLWSHDNFGEDLVINPRAGSIYYYDETNTDQRAVELSSKAGANKVPTRALQVLTSEHLLHSLLQ